MMALPERQPGEYMLSPLRRRAPAKASAADAGTPNKAIATLAEADTLRKSKPKRACGLYFLAFKQHLQVHRVRDAATALLAVTELAPGVLGDSPDSVCVRQVLFFAHLGLGRLHARFAPDQCAAHLLAALRQIGVDPTSGDAPVPVPLDPLQSELAEKLRKVCKPGGTPGHAAVCVETSLCPEVDNAVGMRLCCLALEGIEAPGDLLDAALSRLTDLGRRSPQPMAVDAISHTIERLPAACDAALPAALEIALLLDDRVRVRALLALASPTADWPPRSDLLVRLATAFAACDWDQLDRCALDCAFHGLTRIEAAVREHLAG